MKFIIVFVITIFLYTANANPPYYGSPYYGQTYGSPYYGPQYGPAYVPPYGPAYVPPYGPPYGPQYGPPYGPGYVPPYGPQYGPQYPVPYAVPVKSSDSGDSAKYHPYKGTAILPAATNTVINLLKGIVGRKDKGSAVI